jgi:hypothetical protein
MIDGFIKVNVLVEHTEEWVMKGFPKCSYEKCFIRKSDIVSFQTYKRYFQDNTYSCNCEISTNQGSVMVTDTFEYIEKELSKPTKFNNINN